MSGSGEKLTDEGLVALQERFPELPPGYFEYLKAYGWGLTLSGRMLYSAPIDPEEIFGEAHGLQGFVLLGDDLAGYFFSFRLATKQYGEVDQRGSWQPALTAKDVHTYALGDSQGAA